MRNYLSTIDVRSGKILLSLSLVIALSCSACPQVNTELDAGPHGSILDATGRADTNFQDAEASHDAGNSDGAQGCGPGTPFYGEACGDCGLYVCDMEDNLICYDLGFNLCGVCGDLDQSAGRLDENCGSCGLIACSDDGLSTLCQDEHPHNICGGCEEIAGSSPSDLPADAGLDAEAGFAEDASPVEDAGLLPILHRGPPGATCSSCGTGEWRCSADQNNLVCYHGRGLTACGSCDRCVLASAAMDQRFSANYLRAGTMALIEDTGDDVDTGSDVNAGSNRALVFDPLITGSGASALAMAYVFLSPSLDINDANAVMLSPEFAASSSALLSDDTRRYLVSPWLSLEDFNYVIIYDYFLEQSISVGELQIETRLPMGDGGMLDAHGLADAGAGDQGSDPFDATLSDNAINDLATTDLIVFDAAASNDAGFADTAKLEDAAPNDSQGLELLSEDHDFVDASPEDTN